MGHGPIISPVRSAGFYFVRSGSAYAITSSPSGVIIPWWPPATMMVPHRRGRRWTQSGLSGTLAPARATFES